MESGPDYDRDEAGYAPDFDLVGASPGGAGQELVLPLPPARLPTAKHAGKALVAYLVTQLACGFMVGTIASLIAVASGVTSTETEEFKQITTQVLQYSLVPIMIISGLVVLMVTRSMAADAMTDGSPLGIGWCRCSPFSLLVGALLGAMVSGSFLLLLSIMFSGGQPGSEGPLAEMASQGGITRLLSAILAVICAPLVEEFLFRGVMLAGFTRSWGLPVAVVLCSTIFVALHITELLRFWPATFGLAGIAALTMWLRIRTRSLGPAVAAHLGYNGLLVLYVYLASLLAHV